MTRSNKKKSTKRVKKLIRKLKDECFNLKKHYEEKVTQLHLKLLDKEYYLNTILDFMNCNFRSTWDRAVYRRYHKMCYFDD